MENTSFMFYIILIFVPLSLFRYFLSCLICKIIPLLQLSKKSRLDVFLVLSAIAWFVACYINASMTCNVSKFYDLGLWNLDDNWLKNWTIDDIGVLLDNLTNEYFFQSDFLFVWLIPIIALPIKPIIDLLGFLIKKVISSYANKIRRKLLSAISLLLQAQITISEMINKRHQVMRFCSLLDSINPINVNNIYCTKSSESIQQNIYQQKDNWNIISKENIVKLLDVMQHNKVNIDSIKRKIENITDDDLLQLWKKHYNTTKIIEELIE